MKALILNNISGQKRSERKLMKERYVLFDVETPNSRNNRMSAIGITVIENEKIIDERYYLVNPECEFNSFNVYLTGITPQMVEGERNFGELWREIEPLFDSGLVMAHNAPFDMSVLGKCLKDYGIEWKEKVNYACTCNIAKKLFPKLPDHKLDTMCAYFDIELNHHNAASDSHACAELMLNYLSRDFDINKYIRTYDLEKICTVKK